MISSTIELKPKQWLRKAWGQTRSSIRYLESVANYLPRTDLGTSVLSAGTADSGTQDMRAEQADSGTQDVSAEPADSGTLEMSARPADSGAEKTSLERSYLKSQRRSQLTQVRMRKRVEHWAAETLAWYI